MMTIKSKRSKMIRIKIRNRKRRMMITNHKKRRIRMMIKMSRRMNKIKNKTIPINQILKRITTQTIESIF